MSLFVTLLTFALIAIPIAVMASLVRRVKQVTRRLDDPARLQQLFAESAVSALRRAGADSQSVARVEPVRAVLMQRPSRPRRQAPMNRGVGLDMGDSFRLSEPPELNEPRGPVSFANWLAVALFAAAVTWYCAF
jgi:hypothetical protein